MCVGNEHKPSLAEMEAIKVGYKVFCINDETGKIESPYANTYGNVYDKLHGFTKNICCSNNYTFNYSDAPTDKKGFIEAQNTEREPNAAGFYCFKSLASAQKMVELKTKLAVEYPSDLNRRRMVILRVAVKDIIGIGDVERMFGYSYDREFIKDDVIRCKKVKLLDEPAECVKMDSPQ